MSHKVVPDNDLNVRQIVIVILYLCCNVLGFGMPRESANQQRNTVRILEEVEYVIA